MNTNKAIFLALGFFSILSLGVLADTEKPPNLLVIITDEHNFRTLGVYRDLLPRDQALMWGDAVVQTPHIDRIGKDGLVCTSFYATTPVCTPARGTFFSGLYPQTTGVVTNDISFKDDVITFGEVLRRKGYATSFVGKWHLDGDGKPKWAPKRKFGFEDNRFMFNRGHWKKLLMTDGIPRVAGGATLKNGKANYAVANADEKTFATDFLSDRTIDFIEAKKDKPFCVVLSLPDPHGPDTVRAPYDTMYDHQEYTQPVSAKKSNDGLPYWSAKTGKSSFKQNKYYGMVKCIDDNIGKILASLEKAKVLDNTIIVFTSDHGDFRGEHGRQNKGSPLEASARIPFLVRYPKCIKAGTVINEALGTIDFMQTILALMNVPYTGKQEGRDASSLFIHGKAPAEWNDVAILRSTSGKDWIAAISDRYKLVLTPKHEPWLLDLKKDPNELVNQVMNPKHHKIVKNLASQLQSYGTQRSDARINDPFIRGDLAWATGNADAYPSRKSKQSDHKKK